MSVVVVSHVAGYPALTFGDCCNYLALSQVGAAGQQNAGKR